MAAKKKPTKNKNMTVRETVREYQEPLPNPNGLAPEEDIPIEESFHEPDVYDRLRNMREGLSGQGQIRIRASKQIGGEYIFQGWVPADVDIEDYLQRTWKGGRYLIRFYIDGRPVDTVSLAVADPIDNGASPNGSPSSEIQALRDSINDLKVQIATARSAPPAEKTSVGELAEAVKTVVDLQKPAPTQNTNLKETLELVREMFTFSKQMAGEKPEAEDKDWKTLLMETIRDIAPAAAAAFGPKTRPASLAGPLPTIQNSEEQMRQQQEQEDAYVKAAIEQLKPYAYNRVDVNIILDWAETNAQAYAPLIRRVTSGEFKDLAALSPDIGTEPLFGWFKSLYDGLRSSFGAGDSLDGDTGGKGGNDGDATGYGEARTGGRK